MSEIGIGGGRGPDLFGALKDGRIQGTEARLKASAQLMEGQFYQNLFTAMRETVPEGGLTSGGQGEEMFSSLMDQHMADATAARGESPLSKALYRVFARTAGIEADGGGAAGATQAGSSASGAEEEGAFTRVPERSGRFVAPDGPHGSRPEDWLPPESTGARMISTDEEGR